LIQVQLAKSSTGIQESHSSAPINFQDIYNSPYRESINILAQQGIIDASSYKFYPENYLSTYEMVIMLVKAELISSKQV